MEAIDLSQNNRDMSERGDNHITCDNCCCDSYCSPCLFWTFFSLFLIAVIVVCVTVPLSYHYIEYDEMAFNKDIYGTTDFSKVLHQQRLFLPLTHTVVKFPTTYRPVSYLKSDGTNLRIFSDTGLEFDIDVVFYYRLIDTNLTFVYRTYNKNYNDQIVNIAKSVIKDTAVHYSSDDYVSKRLEIRYAFATAVKSKLESDVGVEIPIEYFILLNVVYPDNLIAINLESVKEVQNNELLANQQQVNVIIAQTAAMVANITAQTQYLLANANILANQTIVNSQSTATNIVQSANGIGISNVIDMLNMTDSPQKTEFIELLLLLDATNPRYLHGDFTPLVN
jgi:regulator of protease activity HflC (stomatin/prohibitin superfamily)